MPDFLLPFGPFHMVVLHLPIGVLAGIWFLEILLEDKGDKHKSKAIGLLYLFLILSTALTIVLGLSYAELADYGNEIEDHELWGYIFGGCALAAYLCYWINRLIAKHSSKLLYWFSLIVTTIAMTITGHLGGELVHGKGFLTKPFKTETRRTTVVTTPKVTINTSTAASPLKSPPSSLSSAPTSSKPATSAAASTPPAESISEETTMDGMSSMMDAAVPPMPAQASAETESKIVVFESAQAIFKRHCYKCHGATKQKGDYRLDQKDSINLGGKSDLAAIVPGDPDDSELMYRMLLPRDDDDVMPPEEKEAVSPAEIETVRQWIEAGAYWPDATELNTASREYIKVGDANTDELIEQISQTGVKAEYNAWGDESVRIDLGVVDPAQLNTAISQLSNFKDKLTWLDCSELTLPQAFWSEIQQLSHLQRLHLDGTDISDEQLNALSQLPKLSYLNLYNTQISDTGLTALQNCTSLRKLYLSQTKTTPKGIAQLKKARPKLEVIVE